MTLNWFWRSPHIRRLPSGDYTHVHGCWCPREGTQRDKKRRNRSKCPQCGAVIFSVKMPNKGWAHFEGGKGLSRVKHPCFHRGEGYSQCRDDQTGDLFDQERAPVRNAFDHRDTISATEHSSL